MNQDADGRARAGPFNEFERARGALFGELAGWSVALLYADGGRALRAAREAAAIVDLTPLGRIEVSGKDSAALLQRISTNDLRLLRPGRFAATIFVTPKGRIVDRALVFDRGSSLLLVTAPGGRHRLQAWIRKYTLADDVRCRDISEETASFGLTGPAAEGLVRELGLSAPEAQAVAAGMTASAGSFQEKSDQHGWAIQAPFDMLPQAWIVLGQAPAVEALYERALALGDPRGVAPAGLNDAEILRVEAGIPTEGRELTEEQNPWEARLDGLLSLSKGCYTGQEVIARLRTYDKVQRLLVGLRLGPVTPPVVPLAIHDAGAGGAGREVGILTSAVSSDRMGETIGLGFVRVGFDAPGTTVLIGEERGAATIAALPFAV